MNNTVQRDKRCARDEGTRSESACVWSVRGEAVRFNKETCVTRKMQAIGVLRASLADGVVLLHLDAWFREWAGGLADGWVGEPVSGLKPNNCTCTCFV